MFLIGLSGAGKSTLGRLVAGRLGRTYADLDDVLEEWEGVSIPEIFREKGEDYFRRKETEVLRWAAGERRGIFSTGGGVVVREENIALMRESGRVIFLDRPIEHILRDIVVSGRPMLRGDKQNLIALREARLDLYRKAADVCLANDRGADAAAEMIMDWVRRWERTGGIHMEITREARLAALLGYPLGHSFSPAMQNAAFEAAGMNCIYLPVEVKAEDLGDVIRGMAKMNYLGCNVTIPHKVAVMEHLDEIAPAARTIGAVNAVVFKEGRAIGHNVDGLGFSRSLTEETGETAQGKTLFVLGAGGASRAICAVFAMEGARRIYICNRTEARADALAAYINGSIRNCCESVPWEPEAMTPALRDSDVLVNATSVGMYPRGDALCLDAGLLAAGAAGAVAAEARAPGSGPPGAGGPRRKLLVCDIVYNPVRTRLLEEAEKLGLRTLNGLAMLAGQGEASFELWTGTKPPEGIMRAALERIAAKPSGTV